MNHFKVIAFIFFVENGVVRGFFPSLNSVFFINKLFRCRFSPSGDCFLVGSSENSVWLLSGSAASGFETLGFLRVQGQIHEIESRKLASDVSRFVITSNPYPENPKTSAGFYRYIQIDIPSALLQSKPSFDFQIWTRQKCFTKKFFIV